MFIDYIKDGPRTIQEAGQKTRVETGTLRWDGLSQNGAPGPWAGSGRGFKGGWSGPSKLMSALSALKPPRCPLLKTRLGWPFIFLVIFACPANFLHFWMASPLSHGLSPCLHILLLAFISLFPPGSLYISFFFSIVSSLPFISWFSHEHSAATICGRSTMAASNVIYCDWHFLLFQSPSICLFRNTGNF